MSQQENIGEQFRGEIENLIGQLQTALADVIRGMDERPALIQGADAALQSMKEPLPDTGCGTRESIEQLLELDDLNQRLGEFVIADGRFMAGTSRIGKRTIFRPAFSSWRTRNQDVEEFASVVVEPGQSLL